jgi:hypothetical protein
MPSVQLMQTDLTYNITMDSGESYTALVMEDFYSGCFSIDIYDDEENLIEDENLIFKISSLIEEGRS